MSESNQKQIVEAKEHHKPSIKCTTRPPYRQGRKLTSVKVYTINDESQHLLIFGVPKLKLAEDLKRLCLRFGFVRSLKVVENYPDTEEFTEVFHVRFSKLSSARFARLKLANTSFYGSILRVCYAPELESVQETRSKLLQRQKGHFKFRRLKYQSDGNVNKNK